MSESVNKAIRDVFISPNVADKNFEAANVVDTLDDIARGLFAIARAINKKGDSEEIHEK